MNNALNLDRIGLKQVLVATLLVSLLFPGAGNNSAQTTPATVPNKVWTGNTSSDWFNGANWTPAGVPGGTDNVGIGSPLISQIGIEEAASARTVTLGTLTGPSYAPGELDINGGSLTIDLPGTATVPGLQVLSGSTLQIRNFGTVNVQSSSVDNFGIINDGTDGSGARLNVSAANTIRNEARGVINGFLSSFAGLTIVNSGTISGTANTEGPTPTIVDNAGTATITNNAGGTISSPDSDAIMSSLPFSGATPVVVVNSGTISGGLNGVNLGDGGTITNNAGGSITGTNGNGILGELPISGVAPAISVANSGTISGTNGIEAEAGGSITNNAGGVIRGTDGAGIIASAAALEGTTPPPLTVVNSGTISGISVGIELDGGGSITNEAGGSIIGANGNPAVTSSGRPLSFSNAGTVTGNVVTLGNFVNHAVLMTGGSIAGNLNLGTNAGTTLTLDGSGAELLSQAVTAQITFNGSLTKQGAGTWSIDKSLGNFPGGTTVRAGTLVDASTNALGTGGVSVTGNTSIFRINQGISITNPILLTQGGTVDNAGTIQAPPQGLLSGVGSGHVINEGTGAISNAVGNAVAFNAGGTLTNQAGGSIQSRQAAGVNAVGASIAITNSGTISGVNGIVLGVGGAVTNNASGVITGTSRLAILSAGGPATLTNSGTINGSVQLANFANQVSLFPGGKINGDLNLGTNSGSNLVLDGAGQQAISQAVSGATTNPGTLTKQGSSQWIIDQILNAPVATNVLAGVLEVNGTLSSPKVNVLGGTLKGSGNIFGNVINFGTVSPGNSPGTLVINGNYTQGPSGVFEVQIASASLFSRLIVTGHASLDGTLKLTLASGFTPKPGDQFQILKANQGISGTFRNIVSNTPVDVTYQNGVVNVIAATVKAPTKPEIHFSDGTPNSTTALIAAYSFYGFGGSLAERMALGIVTPEEANKEDAVSITFDAGEFDIQGHHGTTYTIPIAGGFKINDRVRLNYEIPLQYVTVAGTSLFQIGTTFDVPIKVIVPSENQAWSWDMTPTAAFAASGSRELIGGGALSNLVAYRWHGMTAAYGNYISFFEGNVLTSNDAKFSSAVDQQIMKNGLRVDVPFAKSWLVEVYGIYTQFFQSAAISSYATIGAEIGHHFTWTVENQNLDLGYLSFGLYTEFGNHYSSGHIQVGSAWRF